MKLKHIEKTYPKKVRKKLMNQYSKMDVFDFAIMGLTNGKKDTSTEGSGSN